MANRFFLEYFLFYIVFIYHRVRIRIYKQNNINSNMYLLDVFKSTHLSVEFKQRTLVVTYTKSYKTAN